MCAKIPTISTAYRIVISRIINEQNMIELPKFLVVHIRLVWLASCSMYLLNNGMLPLESLTEQLTMYELLSQKEYNSIQNTTHMLFTWTAFTRHFEALLWPAQTFVSRDIRISIADGRQLPTTSSLIPTFYKGKLMNEAASNIVAHENFNGEISMTVISEFGTLIVQSASLVLPRKYSAYLLVYRLEDVKNPNISLLNDIVRVNFTLKSFPLENFLRSKRMSSKAKRFCGVNFFADFSFFDKVAGRSYVKAIELLVKQFDQVNEIFLSTKFIGRKVHSLKGYGFYLKEILIETKPPAKNLQNFTAQAILEDFSYKNLGTACLHHLFTFSPEPNNILGFTFVASPSAHHLGGICSKPYFLKDGRRMEANTGYTSFADKRGRQLLSATATLVTAHELGHSWGAGHDPAGDECTPGAAKGGRYLMFPYAVSGYSPNNYKFSVCSRRSIGTVLERKSHRCFEDESQISVGQCGNFRLDPGEECDPGRSGANKCCLETCKLAPGAQCSPFNHKCCTKDCKIAAAGTICSEVKAITPCLSAGYCDGTSLHCPPPAPSLSKRCHEHGYCDKGICKSFCSSFGLKTCICDKTEVSCLICCSFKVRSGREIVEVCQPMVIKTSDTQPNGIYGTYSSPPEGWKAIAINKTDAIPATDNVPILFLWNMADEKPRNDLNVMHLDCNRPCPYGVCRSGVCQESKAKRIGRLWSLFERFVDNKIARYIWANVVSIILCLAAVVWVPLSILIHHYDSHMEEARKHLENRLFFSNYERHLDLFIPATRTRRRTL